MLKFIPLGYNNTHRERFSYWGGSQTYDLIFVISTPIWDIGFGVSCEILYSRSDPAVNAAPQPTTQDSTFIICAAVTLNFSRQIFSDNLLCGVSYKIVWRCYSGIVLFSEIIKTALVIYFDCCNPNICLN